MATLVLLEGKAKPGQAMELLALLRDELPATRRYDGCRGVTAHTSGEDDHALVLVEHWDSQAHYERYIAWRRETGVLARLVALFEAPPQIRYFEPQDI